MSTKDTKKKARFACNHSLCSLCSSWFNNSAPSREPFTVEIALLRPCDIVSALRDGRGKRFNLKPLGTRVLSRRIESLESTPPSPAFGRRCATPGRPPPEWRRSSTGRFGNYCARPAARLPGRAKAATKSGTARLICRWKRRQSKGGVAVKLEGFGPAPLIQYIVTTDPPVEFQSLPWLHLRLRAARAEARLLEVNL